MDAVTQVPAPVNEPVHSYAPGSPERARLEAKLKELAGEPGRPADGHRRRAARWAAASAFDVVQPHNHGAVLGTVRQRHRAQDAQDAVDAALAAAPGLARDVLRRPRRDLPARRRPAGRPLARDARRRHHARPVQDRAAGRDRQRPASWSTSGASTSTTPGRSSPSSRWPTRPGVWNRLDHRPLEGFVYAITPFNFTAIAGNLPTAPALMGNVVVWKPSPTQTHSAVLLMELLEEAGLPDGVINLVTGDGLAVSEVALTHPDLAGIHFTGSTATFQHLWRTVGENIARLPHLPAAGRRDRRQGLRRRPPVGRPGGAEDRADPRRLRVPGPEVLGRLPRLRPALDLGERLQGGVRRRGRRLTMGDVTDLGNFIGAVIDERAFAKNKAAIDRAKADPTVEVLAGGTYDDSVGYFVRPTVAGLHRPGQRDLPRGVLRPDPRASTSTRTPTSTRCSPRWSPSPSYALTGSVIARDRAAVAHAMEQAALRGRQLLHQRQVHRRGRRPAALRRRPGLRHQRQGRRRAEPACAGPPPARSRRPSSRRRTTATRTRADAGAAIARPSRPAARASRRAAARVRTATG